MPPKIAKTGIGWFNLEYFIMAEYVETKPGKRKLRVTMDEGQTRDMDPDDADRFIARLDALDAELTDKLGLKDPPPSGKRIGGFKDRKPRPEGEGSGEPPGPSVKPSRPR